MNNTAEIVREKLSSGGVSAHTLTKKRSHNETVIVYASAPRRRARSDP